jgi:hypothetical protein
VPAQGGRFGAGEMATGEAPADLFEVTHLMGGVAVTVLVPLALVVAPTQVAVAVAVAVLPAAWARGASPLLASADPVHSLVNTGRPPSGGACSVCQTPIRMAAGSR